jgi:hypothetical protein
MNSKVTITTKSGDNYEYRNVNDVFISSGWRIFSDYAKLRLPNIKKSLELNYTIGDAIKIELAYDGAYQTEFKGFIASISPTAPYEIRCEDEMFFLKQKAVNNGKGKSWSSITLHEVFKYLVPEVKILSSVPNTTFKPFSIRNDVKCVAEALEKLAGEYLLAIYFINGQLFVGLPYYEKDLGEVIYHFQKNVPLNGSDLTFKKASDVKQQVKVTAKDSKGKSISSTVGDFGGNTSTWKLNFEYSKDKVAEFANEALLRTKYTGWRGYVLAFGRPWVRHSMIATLINNRYPSMNSSSFIDKVETTYNQAGYRRKVYLGRAVS